MNDMRPLRGILFVYELVRLLALMGIFTYYDPGGAPFPWLVYAVPNVLFPLTVLFLWIDGAAYGAYAPLYTAGKVVAAVTALGWFFFRWNADAALLVGRGDLPVIAGSALFMTAGDLFSAAAGLLLVKRLKTGRREPEPRAEGPADGGG
ncbi:MAG: hypothetical protein LBP23_03835 [Treponema sp.]|nr:hypothetical protein [Treponema sp.]